VRFEGDVPIGDKASVDLIRRLAVTRGLVEEIHRERRDSRLSWPCFLTDARYQGGMSGGLVIGDDGRVVGVVCSSTSGHTEESLPEPSFATLVAALPMSVPPGRQDEPPRRLVGLGDAGIVSVSGIDQIDVVEQGGKQVLVYRESDQSQ
jgi:hypothetical protein